MKKKSFVENRDCGKWAGGPASRVWVNHWEKYTKKIITRVRYKGKNEWIRRE